MKISDLAPEEREEVIRNSDTYVTASALKKGINGVYIDEVY
jgi:hypothetical protein